MGKTKIDWCDRVWNIATGCTKVSSGCKNCYAERMSKRLAGRAGYPEDGFKVTLHPGKLEEPLKWKKPSRIFVCSMGDLFHKDVPDEFIGKVWDTIWASPQHTFLILTKRPDRMMDWVKGNASVRSVLKPGDILSLDSLFHDNQCGYADEPCEESNCNNGYMCSFSPDGHSEKCEHGRRRCHGFSCPIAAEGPSRKSLIKAGYNPADYEFDSEGFASDSDLMVLHARPFNNFAENVYLGVSVEDQKTADERIPLLLQTPAAKRFVSYEPAISRVDFSKWIGGDDATEEYRGCSLSGSLDGRIGDRQSGTGLEDIGAEMEPLAAENNQHSMYSETGGKLQWEISSSEGDGGEAASKRLSPSPRISSFFRGDTGGINDKSQERHNDRQQVGEFGAGDIFGAVPPHAICIEEGTRNKPMGVSKSQCKNNKVPSKKNSQTQSDRREVISNCKGLRDNFSDSFRNKSQQKALSWIICGGESGPGARPMHPDWARSVRNQCKAAGIPYFFKQWGEWGETQCVPGGDLGGDMKRDTVRIVKLDGENDGHFWRGDVLMRRVGKKAAGCLLDGREWKGVP